MVYDGISNKKGLLKKNMHASKHIPTNKKEG